MHLCTQDYAQKVSSLFFHQKVCKAAKLKCNLHYNTIIALHSINARRFIPGIIHLRGSYYRTMMGKKVDVS